MWWYQATNNPQLLCRQLLQSQYPRLIPPDEVFRLPQRPVLKLAAVEKGLHLGVSADARPLRTSPSD
eukprot:UN00705